MYNEKKYKSYQKAKEGNDDEDQRDNNKYGFISYTKNLMNQVIIKKAKQIENIRQSGKYLTELLRLLHSKTKAGISLIELEFVAEHYIKTNNLK